MSSEKPFAMDGNATDTADNATNAADNATDAASPQRQLHATEQNSTSAEPELTDLQASPQTDATDQSLVAGAGPTEHAQAMSSEKRLAWNGNAYTREEFLAFYGSKRLYSK